MSSSHMNRFDIQTTSRLQRRGVVPHSPFKLTKSFGVKRAANDNPASLRFFLLKLGRWVLPVSAGMLLMIAAFS